MPCVPTGDLMHWVDQRLANLLMRPGMWGNPDQVEVQFLLLLEFRLALVTHPAKIGDAEVQLRLDYQKHLADSGFQTAVSLSSQVQEEDQMVPVLRSFREKLRAIEQWGPTAVSSGSG